MSDGSPVDEIKARLVEALPYDLQPVGVGFKYHPGTWKDDRVLTGYGRMVIDAIAPAVAALLTEASAPRTFSVDRPCPSCGNLTLFGYLLHDEAGEHMHTHYVCRFWPSSDARHTQPCGWHGWTVPGWDQSVAAVGPPEPTVEVPS